MGELQSLPQKIYLKGDFTMGATSVTGVGLGSSLGGNKGAQEVTLGVGKLIGPHIVAAGTETLSGTTATIELPAPASSVTGYAVFLSNNSSTHAYVSTALVVSSEVDTWKFVVTAGSGDIVKWMVVKLGL